MHPNSTSRGDRRASFGVPGRNGQADSRPTRPPPHNIEAEQGVLGSILLDNDVLHDVVGLITADDFYRASHQVLYQAILDMHARGVPSDAITLVDHLSRRDLLQAIGGHEAISQVLNSVPHAANAKYYAGIVREKAIARGLIDAANEILRDGYSNNFTAEQLLKSAEQKIGGISAAATAGPAGGLEDLGFRYYSDIVAKPVRWAWKYRAAQDEFNLLAGEGGLGKSMTLNYYASLFSVGGEWPDGSGACAPTGKVVILSAEDHPETTIKPRLMALKGDLSMIVNLTAKYRRKITIKGKDEWIVSHQSLQNVDYFNMVFDQIGDVRCLIVDPLPSYLGRSVRSNNNEELREVLERFIDEVIRPRSITFYGNTHLNKTLDGVKNPLHRIMGSVAYVNLARTVSMIARDPEDDGLRLFRTLKVNQGPDDLPALTYRIRKADVTGPDGATIEVGIPDFEGAIDISRQDFAHAIAGGGQRPGPKPTAIEPIAEWLIETLKAGPKSSRQLFDAAGAAGHVGALKETSEGKLRWSKGKYLYRARDLVNDGHEWRIEQKGDIWELRCTIQE